MILLLEVINVAVYYACEGEKVIEKLGEAWLIPGSTIVYLLKKK